MLPMVSVVVPIYEVEKYIHRCVDSIINQTYPNIEIILVDDGSPDNCGKVADQYATVDNRIKSVHKKNGGLSDARNFGMRYVIGEFTLFVDSDDWLELNIVEELVNTCLANEADVVQSAFYYAYDDYLLFDNRYYKKSENPEILDNFSLMSALVVNKKVKNFAWGKLFKTELIKDLPFKKGVLFEDVFWAHQVMHRVNKFALLHKPMYYYYQRDDSIVANYTIRNLDMIKGLKERHCFIEKFYKDLINDSYKVIFEASIIHYNLLLRNRRKDKDGSYRKDIQSYIQSNFSKLNKAVEADRLVRRQLQLFCIHPYLNILFLLGRRFMRKIKILPQSVGLERYLRKDGYEL